MGRRSWKPPVKPEVRLDWVRRYELEGQSPPQIAKKDGYDVRTVRQQIKDGIRDREEKEAKLAVMKDALQEHYRELCKYAESLNPGACNQPSLDGNPFNELAGDPYLGARLREHLPRSPIWKLLNNREKQLRKVNEFEGEIRARVQSELSRNPLIRQFENAGEIQASTNLKEAFVFQAISWGKGHQGLNTKENLRITQPKPGVCLARYGSSQLGEIQATHGAKLDAMINGFETKIKDWEEVDGLKKVNGILGRIEKELRDEIAVITHRRVVPGKCKFCPV